MNALKHAGTSEVRVSLSRVDKQTQLQVRDAGRGFDPAALDGGLANFDQGGFGLFNIRERLRGLGGRLDIDSAPGKGTSITIRLPSSA
jgi:signal transduction histidine kinase